MELIPDNYGIYPLELAADEENWPTIALLLDIGADVGATGLDAQMLAVRLREEGFVEQADKLSPKKKRSHGASTKSGAPAKKVAQKRTRQAKALA